MPVSGALAVLHLLQRLLLTLWRYSPHFRQVSSTGIKKQTNLVPPREALQAVLLPSILRYNLQQAAKFRTLLEMWGNEYKRKNLNKVLLPAKDTYVSVRYTLSAALGRSVNYPASKYLMRFTQGNGAGARTHTHTPRQWKSERERERVRVRAREQNNIRGIQSLRSQKKNNTEKNKNQISWARDKTANTPLPPPPTLPREAGTVRK